MQKRQLQQKIRRSSSISPIDIVQCYLEYASLVRDEKQVYEFMEQNNIGIDYPKYWLCRFKHLARLCQFNQIAKLMKKIRQNRSLRTHLDFSQIITFESETICQLKRIYLSKHVGRRSMKQYKLFINIKNKNPRKIGGMEIWVDEPFQQQFALQDYAQVIENRFPQQKKNAQMRHNEQHKHLQYSFIHQAQEDLQKKSSGLLNKAETNKSQTKNRKSLRIIDNIQHESENENMKHNETPTKNRNQNYEDDKQLDSVQIIYKRNLWKRHQSPKFRQQGQYSSSRSSIRARQLQSQKKLLKQQLQIPRCQQKIRNNEQFSFQKRSSIYGANNNATEQIQPSVFQNWETQNKLNDQARIQLNSVMQASKPFQQYEFQLGLLISECQREKYEQKNKYSSSFPNCQTNSNAQNEDIRSISISSIRAQKRKNNPNGRLMVITPRKQEGQEFQFDADCEKSYKGTMEDLLQNIDQQISIIDPTPHFKRTNKDRRVSMSDRPNRKNRQVHSEERNGFTYSFLPSEKRRGY